MWFGVNCPLHLKHTLFFLHQFILLKIYLGILPLGLTKWNLPDMSFLNHHTAWHLLLYGEKAHPESWESRLAESGTMESVPS